MGGEATPFFEPMDMRQREMRAFPDSQEQEML
jgi:hypothetical protein